MPRTKVVNDSALFKLIDQHLLVECKGDARKLKLPEIADYVRKSGYPRYAVESLRRNKAAREYINTLKAVAPDKAFVHVVSYKTLDVTSFLQKNQTTATLKEALTALDVSYKNIAESAVEIYNRMEDTSKKMEALSAEIESLKAKNTELMNTIAGLNIEHRALRSENKLLRSVVDTYVYPDIANELLSEVGVLKKVNSCVDPAKMEPHIITGSTPIATVVTNSDEIKTKSGSTVIKGLFGSFED